MRATALAAAATDKMTKMKLPKWHFSFDPRPLYREIAHRFTRFVYRPHYIGFENIPTTGPAILICNHVSYVDGPIIDAGTTRHIRYIIDEDIYKLPGVHYIMSLAQAIPIAANRKSVEAALNEISAGLKAGDIICIFPEGELTYTGGLGRFRPGIEWMLKRDPVPVIPIALSGLWGSMFSRKDLKTPLLWRLIPKRWLRYRVKAICGKPIPAGEAANITVNQLQEIILKLKYSLNQQHRD